MNDSKIRCEWAQTDPLLKEYHDTQWGVSVHDDRLLFEMLNLEAAQAGLSWLTVLKKRDGYRRAFDNFDIENIADYSDAKLVDLMLDEAIIRNRLKINAVRENAKASLAVIEKYGSLDVYLWSFVDNKQITRADSALAAQISTRMSKDLKNQGFKFLGPTTCHSFMQAVGMINDHTPNCFRYTAINTVQ